MIFSRQIHFARNVFINRLRQEDNAHLARMSRYVSSDMVDVICDVIRWRHHTVRLWRTIGVTSQKVSLGDSCSLHRHRRTTAAAHCFTASDSGSHCFTASDSGSHCFTASDSGSHCCVGLGRPWLLHAACVTQSSQLELMISLQSSCNYNSKPFIFVNDSNSTWKISKW
jgi:hypothetical protein